MFLFRKPTMAMFLAWRYLTYPEKSSFTRFAMRISVFAVAFGAMALATTLMITSGTKKAIYGKIKSLTANTLFYKSDGSKINIKEPAENFFVPAEFSNKIITCHGSVTSVVVKDKNDCFVNVFLKGIDWKSVDQVLGINQFLNSKVKAGAILASGQVIVGKNLIQALGLNPGDNVFEISVPEPRSKTSVRLRPQTVKIGAVFNTGLYEFDNGVIFCSQELFWSIYKNEGLVDHIIVKVLDSVSQKPKFSFNLLALLKKALSSMSAKKNVLEQLSQSNPTLVRTDWKEMYKSLLSCMELERNIMLLIIFFIALIAMVNLASLLVLQIQAKQRDITVLRVLGVGQKQIRSIFVLIALAIVAWGTFIGMFLALALALLFSKVWIIPLPESYFIDHIFFDINPMHFALVLALMLFCGLIAALFPTSWILKLQINRGFGQS